MAYSARHFFVVLCASYLVAACGSPGGEDTVDAGEPPADAVAACPDFAELPESGEATVTGETRLINLDQLVSTQLRYALFARRTGGDTWNIVLMNQPRTCADILDWAWEIPTETGEMKEQLAFTICNLDTTSHLPIGNYADRRGDEFSDICADNPQNAIWLPTYRRLYTLPPEFTIRQETLSLSVRGDRPTDAFTLHFAQDGEMVCGTVDLDLFTTAFGGDETYGRLQGSFAARFCDGEYEFPVQPGS